MINLFDLVKGVKQYLALFQQGKVDADRTCQHCGCHKIHRHGVYYRWATTIADHYRIPIQRYRCPSCGKTFSLLPNFIAPWQRFHTGLREKALRLRFEDGLSWREIARRVGKRNEASWVNVQLWGRRAIALLALLSEILLRELSRWRPGMDAT